MKDLSQHAVGFRHKEVSQLVQLIEAGESASIIGMSGTGKSNLFNHLCAAETQDKYFAERPLPIIVRVNFHFAPDFTDRSLYSLILEQLESLEPGEIQRLELPVEVNEQIGWFHDSLLDARDDLLKVQRNFKQAIRLLLYGTNRRLVFLFDQFDDIYREAPAHFFANLRGLRELYKYRVSYLIFTRDMLPNLMESDPSREEFYELLASNLIGLTPYNKADSEALIRRVGERIQLSINDKQTKQLITQTGGHAGLLRATFLAVARQEAGAGDTVGLLAISGVQTETRKIWRSLSVQERKVLHTIVHGQQPSGELGETLQQLQIKGVIQKETNTVFAPIFVSFVRQQDPIWERPLYLDEAARQLWVLGQAAPQLTSLEYRLFEALYDREGEVLNKDELIEAGWPAAQGGVSDEALTAAMARLRRKVEPDSRNPRFLQNMRNQGYTLRIE